MAEEIQYLDDELKELCTEIRAGIADITNNKRLTVDKRSEKILQLTDRINRAKQVYHSFKVELRELSRDELREYELKGKEHNNVITQLVKDLTAAKTTSDKSELMSGAKEKEGFDAESASAGEVIAEAARVQDQSKASLGRSLKIATSAEAIGMETAIQLKAQTEQLKGIHANVTQIESNLKRADILMRQFIKRMATDKVVLCFILLLVIGIIAIIAYKATHKGSGSAPST